MELYPNLDMIRDDFTKELQGSQFRHFCNIILGIHENDITYYNKPRIELLEKQKIKLEKEKEEAQV